MQTRIDTSKTRIMEVKIFSLRLAACENPSKIAVFLGMNDGEMMFLVNDYRQTLTKNLESDMNPYNLRKKRKMLRQPQESEITCEIYCQVLNGPVQNIQLNWLTVKKAILLKNEDYICATPYIRLPTKTILRNSRLRYDMETALGNFVSCDVECSICLEEYPCVYELHKVRGKLKEEMCFFWQCKCLSHATCVGCARKMLLNFENHPLNPHIDGVSCPNLECRVQTPFLLKTLYSILTDKQVGQMPQHSRRVFR